MQPTKRVFDRLKAFEGLRLRRYQDSAGVDTIGYGHTKYAPQLDEITPEQAAGLLVHDVSEFTTLVNNYMKVRKYRLNQNQFDALVLFTYNTGGIKNGSALDSAIRAKDAPAAAREMLKYTYAKGQQLPGLVKRRQYEARLFVTPYLDLKNILVAVPFLL